MARVVVMGSKDVGVRVCRAVLDATSPPHAVAAVLTPDDRADGRSRLPALEALAADAGLPLRVTRTVGETEEALAAAGADLAVVAGWYQLVRLDRSPATAFYGLHASPLPRYRGNAPLVWQILNGEAEVGLSLFRFAAGMDDGDLVGQRTRPLGRDEGIGEALSWVEDASVELVREHLAALLDGTAPHRAQDHAAATYCGLRLPEDGRVHWTWSARRVHDFIRAQGRPYPGAFTQLADGRPVRLWRAAVDPRVFFGVPGSVLERTADGAVTVACGEGAVRVLEAQVDGEAAAPPRAIFTSLRTRLA